MVRILHVVPNMDAGGLETFIMNMYRNIDREKIQFDFLVHYKKKCHYDDEIERLGGKIYRLSFREDNNFIKYIYQLIKFFKNHKEYKIIHGHMLSAAFFYLGIAKINKVPIRIIHSHNTSTEKNLKGNIKSLMLKLSKINSNLWLACSQKAGNFIYGNKEFKVINNAIDLNKFQYNNTVRDKIRKELKIEDKFVVGHIGRFNSQKNHIFLLEIFSELCKKNTNSILILIGKGELEEVIKSKIEELDLQDKVMLLGVRSDINDIYQGLDVFVLPSLFEGLPVVGVESQAAGLQTILSDTISDEIRISNNVHFLKLTDGAKAWAEYINSLKSFEHIITTEQIKNNGYDIKIECEKLSRLYINKLQQIVK